MIYRPFLKSIVRFAEGCVESLEKLQEKIYANVSQGIIRLVSPKNILQSR